MAYYRYLKNDFQSKNAQKEFNDQQKEFAEERDKAYRDVIISSLESGDPCWNFDINNVPYKPFYITRAGQEFFSGFAYTQKNFFLLNDVAKKEHCNTFLSAQEATRLNYTIKDDAKPYLVSLFMQPGTYINSEGNRGYRGGWEYNDKVYSTNDINDYKKPDLDIEEILNNTTQTKKCPVRKIEYENTDLADSFLKGSKGENESYSEAFYRTSYENYRTCENETERQLTSHCAAAWICLSCGLSYDSNLALEQSHAMAEELRNSELNYENVLKNAQLLVNRFYTLEMEIDNKLENQNVQEKVVKTTEQSKTFDNHYQNEMTNSYQAEDTAQMQFKK